MELLKKLEEAQRIAKQSNGIGGYVKLYNEDLETLISLLESERWIPVEERLPERGETLLFCTDLGYVTQGFLAYGPDVFVESFTSSEYSNVTNWRPLPKPPVK